MRKSAKNSPHYHLLKDAEWLRSQYIDKEISIQKLADSIDVPFNAIRTALLKNNIPLKPQKIYGHVNHPNRKGDNHPNWKGGLPKCLGCAKQLNFGRTRCWNCYKELKGMDNRFAIVRPNQIGRYSYEYVKWRTTLFQHYSYKCYICGNHDRKLAAHHLNSYASNPDQRFDFNNGIVLCSKHHSYFHKNYGFHQNTKEQFYDYLSNLAEII